MFKETIKPTLVLVIIVAVMSGLLAFTYNAAGIGSLGRGIEPEILDAILPDVLPEGSRLVNVDVSIEDSDLLGVYKDETGQGIGIHLQVKGYGSEPMKVMFGINTDGSVAGIKILESSETPGLGTKIEEPSYISQYKGKRSPLAITAEGGEIEAITGATKSSKALTVGVENALKIYESIKGELV